VAIAAVPVRARLRVPDFAGIPAFFVSTDEFSDFHILGCKPDWQFGNKPIFADLVLSSL